MGDLLLLDTHIWVWYAVGSAKIGEPVRKRIESAGTDGRLALSIVSVWELGMLHAKGRIILDMPIQKWVERSIVAIGISLIPLSVEIAIESSCLPGVVHGDPADRMLLATARAENRVLITKDENILKYGEQGFVRVAS